METLGWTLYLPRLLENCFLFLVFFVFLVLPVFFCFGQKPWKKMETLGWTLYLPRLLENCFLFLVFFGSSSFFCFGQKPWKKMETLGWTLYLPRLLENCFFCFGRFRQAKKKEKLGSLEGGGPAQTLRILFFICFSNVFFAFSFGLPDSQGPIVILC